MPAGLCRGGNQLCGGFGKAPAARRAPWCFRLSCPLATNRMKRMKRNVLILCTGNSCRSHMAEGILRAAGGDLFEVFSAGSVPKGAVHPLALEALAEIGIDAS